MAAVNTSGSITRITREIAAAQKNDDLSIAVACRDNDVRSVRALIIGPPETPYEFGFFEFDMKFPKDYPIKSPTVKCITTNGGRCRFNPNIYAEGKVCLSILGTWRGQPGEEWSSAQGLESVLLSIQSLMSSNPYENEPGYEDSKKEESEPSTYIAKIRHETLRISVLGRLEQLLGIKECQGSLFSRSTTTPSDHAEHAEQDLSSSPPTPAADSDPLTPDSEITVYEHDPDATLMAYERTRWDPFADLLKRRFLWYYDAYMRAIECFGDDQDDGTAFKLADFEYPPNSMEGKFEYRNLKTRFEAVRAKLDQESREWFRAGMEQVLDKTRLASQLQFQLKQIQQQWNVGSYSGSRVEVSLPVEDNPFLWRISLFGEPMTNLDGGVWNIVMRIPPNFPDAQPRVTVESPLFHHRVGSSGVLCYFPQKEEELSSHIEAIFTSIEDKSSTYDPRAMVNPDAFALYWGGDAKRKIYNRNLRRSAQESRQILRAELENTKIVRAELEQRLFMARSFIPVTPFEEMVVRHVNKHGREEERFLVRPDTILFSRRMIRKLLGLGAGD